MILKRIDGRFSEVVAEWKGDTVVLIGGGASLKELDVGDVGMAHTAGDLHVIVVNDAYLLAPWADVHYAADAKWHKWHTDGIEKAVLGFSAYQVRERWLSFKGQKSSIQNSMNNIPDENVHILRNKTYPNHAYGISLDPKALITGWHSGYQALNMAILAGASKIILLGYDAQKVDEKNHWFGDHPKVSTPQVYEEMLRAYSAGEKDIRATGVRVINCSLQSAINTFEKMTLQDALKC